MKATADFSTLKPGDRVWMKNNYRRTSIRSVLRLTPKQVVIDWRDDGGYLRRFKLENGYQVGEAVWNPDRIDMVATPTECAEWDAEQERKRIAAEAREVENKRIEAERIQLEELFGDNVRVNEGYEGHTGWGVEMWNLTDEQVVALSEAVKGLK